VQVPYPTLVQKAKYHLLYQPYSYLVSFLEHRLFTSHRVKRLIAVSEGLKRDLIHYYHLCPDRIVVIPNAVDERVFFSTEERAAYWKTIRQQHGLTPDDPRIGVIQRDGKMTTNFILDPGRPVEVDHVRGCNMSFRHVTLERIGGFDSRYIGSNVGEETDVCLRIRQSGWKLVYQPLAVVEHLAAPREGMSRDLFMLEPRSVLWSAHNRAYLFFKNFGYDYRTTKHILGGMQLLFVKLLLQEPSWARARAAGLYAVGAWWGLADSVASRLRASP
jgi:GT2 family glycosyltransferase